MIQEFVDAFMKNKEKCRNLLKEKHPDNYQDIVRIVLETINEKEDTLYGKPNSFRIHEIDDSEYQGVLLFIIPENTPQPVNYWAVKVLYGSCSASDALQNIKDSCSAKTPTEEQLDDYMSLALHIVQGLKKL